MTDRPDLSKFQVPRPNPGKPLGDVLVPPSASTPPPYRDWAGAGFTTAPPSIEAHRITGLVPLGGDYWWHTRYPATSADHILVGPTPQDVADPCYVGPFPVTDNMLSFAYAGGTVRLLVMSPQTITVTQNANAGERRRLPGDRWSTPFPDATAADNQGRTVIRVGQSFMLDTGLHAQAPGPLPVRLSWDVSAYRAQQVVLLFEQASGCLVAHEDSLFSPNIPVEGQPPVWGFADLHCHPMAAKGFGGGLIAGDYDPSSRDAAGLPHCDQPPGEHQPHFRDAGDFLVNNWPDAHPTGQRDGGATFTDWPNFMDGIHQQMHPEWIKRAHDGGLRLMVALVVHTEFLATQHVVHNDLPHDDWSVTQRQVQYWKDVCAAHPDLMAIAPSPQDARAIIASGRIAIVLGLEVDSALARWKSRLELVAEAYRRLPPDQRPPVANHPGAPIPVNQAMLDMLRAMIREQLTALWNLGIRQINPVHLADNAFGYASVYEEAFNLSMSETFGTQFQVTAASDVDYRLGEEREWLTYLAAGVIDGYSPNSGQWNATGVDGHGKPIAGHVNAGRGLTDVGVIAIQEMIRAGFIIDVDHMSRATAAQTFAIAEGTAAAWNDSQTHAVYPLVSAHASFRDLSPRRNWGHEDNPGPGQRAYNHIWPHESEKTAGQLQQLRSVGGMLASITSHIDSLQHQRPDGSTPVANDCAGTTKTWAQELIYAVDAMDGGPVGMGTDMALLREIGPRFGPRAAYGLTDEHLDSARTERHNQALAQDAGVRYDRAGNLPPFSTPPQEAEWKRNPYIKPQDSVWQITFGDEADFATSLWTALATHTAGAGDRPVRDDANEVLRGLRASSAQDAQGISDRARTAWEIWNNLPVTHVDNGPRSDYHLINDAITMWRRMSGPNAPLSRCRTGQRDWDFNTDGLAHYGLLPDMLQDLANVGLPQDVMTALFASAEAYLDLWQRCDRWHIAPVWPPITATVPVARRQSWPSH